MTIEDKNEEICNWIIDWANDFDRWAGYYYWKGVEFTHGSYSKWALYEIADMIWANRFHPAEITLESFRKQLDDFSTKTKDGNRNYVFSVAYDICTLVLDELIMENKNDNTK